VKNSGKCPKCGGSRISTVPGKTGAYGSGPNIYVGMWAWSTAQVNRYVCLECGFVEHWVASPEDLGHIAERFESVAAEPPAPAPMAPPDDAPWAEANIDPNDPDADLKGP